MYVKSYAAHRLSIVCLAIPVSIWGCKDQDVIDIPSSDETIVEGTLGRSDSRIMTISARVYTSRPDEPFTLLVTVDALWLADGTGVAEQMIGRYVVGHVVDDNGQVWADASEQMVFGAGTYADRPFSFGAFYEPMWYVSYLHRFCAESCDMQFRFA